MTLHNRIVIESGDKKVFVSALDWPGWSRSGKSEDEALVVLAEYAERYSEIADIAGLRGVKATAKDFGIVERIKGSGATDFGVPDRPAAVESETFSDTECERQITLLTACWTYFDDVAARVSPELQKGPRGGGRDRDAIVEHVFESERSYVRSVGVKTGPKEMSRAAGLQTHRDAVLEAIRVSHAAGSGETYWPLAYFIRRAAWHVLDHAWEMEDKDLS